MPTSVVATAPATTTLSLSYGACIGCRECVAACPEGAIADASGSDLVAYTREQLTVRGAFEAGPVGSRPVFLGEQRAPGPSLSESAEALAARIRGRFGRSLHVRQVDAGSCNGCELEIAATANPVFDLERFGIHFVASPRHADLLLVTGPVTRNMEVALRRTLEATPQPRVVVAVGACGCTGGLFGEGTYAVDGRRRPCRPGRRLRAGLPAVAASDPGRALRGHGPARGALPSRGDRRGPLRDPARSPLAEFEDPGAAPA